MTDVRRGGAPVALLIHRAHVGADAERITAAVDAARLALENERLHAAAQARLRELRDSRAQIVAAADAERRRLERDLHDGSQQRLLAFAIDLATVRRRVSNASSPADESALAEVEGEVRSALEDLRELAHGIIPRSLADEGLAAALEELAERSAIPMDLAALPDGRCNQTVEGAGYIVVARATADPVVRRASVAVTRRAGRLVIDLELVVTGPLGVVTILELEDRCGAVDGMIALRALASDEVHLQAEMPCAS
jgi:signal transduction histidine kinase